MGREYDAYLRSKAWRRKRKAALKRAEGRCQVCYGENDLHVHHRTYERLGNERLADLTVLCEECHAHFHSRLAVKPHKPPKKQKAQRKRDPLSSLKAVREEEERDRRRREQRKREHRERMDRLANEEVEPDHSLEFWHHGRDKKPRAKALAAESGSAPGRPDA